MFSANEPAEYNDGGCTKMSINNQDGFSLLEMAIAMLAGSTLLLAIISFYPHLFNYSINVYRQFRLEQVLNQAIISLEKDLRRAGFMLPAKANSIKTEVFLEAKITFCIIIHYSYRRNNYWVHQTNPADIFAYRLKDGQLAHKKDSNDCNSSNWERLIDPAEINITNFSVEQHYDATAQKNYFVIHLAAHWQNNSAIHFQLIRVVAGENV